MVTIKALAESVGVSKPGLNKWIERNGYKAQLVKDGNKLLIPESVEQAVRSYFADRDAKPAGVEEQTVSAQSDITAEILALLREQLETKDREIERLHQQVENLQQVNTDLVKAVRELNTLQAMQLTDGSERTPSELRENEESPAGHQGEAADRSVSVARETAEDQPRKRSLWSRLKSRL